MIIRSSCWNFNFTIIRIVLFFVDLTVNPINLLRVNHFEKSMVQLIHKLIQSMRMWSVWFEELENVYYIKINLITSVLRCRYCPTIVEQRSMLSVQSFVKEDSVLCHEIIKSCIDIIKKIVVSSLSTSRMIVSRKWDSYQETCISFYFVNRSSKLVQFRSIYISQARQ